jgi:hypothetical protein
VYMEIVNQVIEGAVAEYSKAQGISKSKVLKEIREHIDKTGREHRRDEPEIDYEESLCRLGYLFRHAPANATLFERALGLSGALKGKLRAAKGSTLQICSVGGGPGTELLGLAKYLFLNPAWMPRSIRFTVLDSVHQWNETWQQLADAVEKKLLLAPGSKIDSLSIAPAFLPLDVVEEKSYRSLSLQFSKADLIVFNYLFSENKTFLDDASAAVARLARAASPGCVFVVIDRLEIEGSFTRNVVKMFTDAGFAKPVVHKLGGRLDDDEQTRDMSKTLRDELGSPRTRFFNPDRSPTVFWFEAVKS